ncbi:hypothetical protein [Streptomyces sp. NPDC127040]|uniref:hypothetical protein n=1 Tax=Streptomyces sp. NPDC127040 TaxID=3347116 RepID=UPI003653A92C
MTYTTPLSEAKAEALRAAAEYLAAHKTPKPLAPTPDGYYNRPDTPAAEVTEALAAVGIHVNSRHL